MLDVRKPIGFLFVIVGALLTGYGIIQPQITTFLIEATKQEITLNLNLPCGVSMLLFGALMLGLAYMDAKKQSSSH
jgi:hypothetical protein